jgi:hypothetical protein
MMGGKIPQCYIMLLTSWSVCGKGDCLNFTYPISVHLAQSSPDTPSALFCPCNRPPYSIHFVSLLSYSFAVPYCGCLVFLSLIRILVFLFQIDFSSEIFFPGFVEVARRYWQMRVDLQNMFAKCIRVMKLTI